LSTCIIINHIGEKDILFEYYVLHMWLKFFLKQYKRFEILQNDFQRLKGKRPSCHREIIPVCP
jgi:hypothetical protein